MGFHGSWDVMRQQAKCGKGALMVRLKPKAELLLYKICRVVLYFGEVATDIKRRACIYILFLHKQGHSGLFDVEFFVTSTIKFYLGIDVYCK